ncbi:hypothetical protein WICPIJ_001802 [Wickerhamomyces pijperi]|uniref:C2H2-type domain-containing protein n=1 Tax=Wickerhamomyces pijperi TaxID=599730 RepID=A0A9P8QCT8_WICPI|nr:hypothetical protein WICPIJ_001802 [Wickerhamomyces pijperi]
MNVADDWLIESPEDSYSPGPFHDQLSYNKVSSSSQQQQYYDNPFLDHHNGSHADQMPSHEDYKTVDDFLTQTLNDLDIPLDPNMSTEKYQHGHTLANGVTGQEEDYYEDMNMSINGISVSNMNTPVKKQHNKGKASGTAIFGFLRHNKTLSIPVSHGAGNGNLMFKGQNEEESQQEDHDPTPPAVNMQEVDEDEEEEDDDDDEANDSTFPRFGLSSQPQPNLGEDHDPTPPAVNMQEVDEDEDEEDDDDEANDSTFPRFGLSSQPQPNLAPSSSSSEPQHTTLMGLKSPTVPREKILTAKNDFIIPSKKDPNSYKFPPSPTATVSESELTPALIQSKQSQDQQQRQQQQKRRGSDYYQPPQHNLNGSSGGQTVNLSSLTPTLQPSNSSKSAANMYQTPHSSPVKYQDPSSTVKRTITKKKSVKSLKRKEAKKTVEVSLEYLKKLESIIKEAQGKDVDIGIEGLREADAEEDEDENNDEEEHQDDEQEEEEEEESYEGQDQVESFPVHLNDEGQEHEDIQRRSSVFSHQSSMNSPIVQVPTSSRPQSSYSSPLKPKSSNTNANNSNNMMNMNVNMNMGLGLGLFRPQSSNSTLSHQPTPPLANIPQFSYTDSTAATSAATASNGPGYALNPMNNGMQGTNFYGNALFGQQYGMQQFPQHQQPMAYFGYQPQFYGLTLQQQQQLAMAQFGGFGQGANHQVMQYPPMGQFQTNANVNTKTSNHVNPVSIQNSVGLGLRYDSQRRASQTQYSPSSKQQQPAQQSIPVLQPLDLQPPALTATSTGSESSPSQSSQSPILNPKESDPDDSMEQFNTKTPSPTLISQATFPNLDGSSVSPNRKKLQQLAMAQFGGFGQGANHQVMQYPPMGQFQTSANVNTNTSVGLGLRYDSQRRASQKQYSPSSKQQQPAQQSIPVLQPLDLQPPALTATSTGSESSPSRSSQSPILNPKESDPDDSVEQFNTKTPSPTLISQATFPNLDGSSVSPNRKKLQPPAQGTKGDLSWTPIIVNDSSFPNPASSATAAAAAVGSNAGEPDMLGGSPSKKKPGEKISTLPPGQIDNYYTGPDVNKLYHCTFRNCDKTFTRRFNVRSHVQTHLCDRPFVCDYPGCMKSFVRHHDLTRHKKSHEEFVHSCECGKKFSRVDALVKHKERVLCVGGVGGRSGVISRGSSVRAHDVEDQTAVSRSPTKSPIKKKQSSTGIMAQQTMKMISFNDKLNNDGLNKYGKPTPPPASATGSAASVSTTEKMKKKNELKVMQRLEHDILRSTNSINNSNDHKSMVPPIMKIQPTSSSSSSTSTSGTTATASVPTSTQPSQNLNSNSSITPDVPVNINYNTTSTSDVDGSGSHHVYMGGFGSYES